MAKHLNITWPIRKLGTYPNGFVQTDDEKHISIIWATANDGKEWVITRHEAKMLARRITQCLERTS